MKTIAHFISIAVLLRVPFSRCKPAPAVAAKHHRTRQSVAA